MTPQLRSPFLDADFRAGAAAATPPRRALNPASPYVQGEREGHTRAEQQEGITDADDREQDGLPGDGVDPLARELGENEFRVDHLPETVQPYFARADASWRDAVRQAISAGMKDPNDLADLVFFMQHPNRISAGTGKLIARGEAGGVELRREWNRYRSMVIELLEATAAALACSVFLPANVSTTYEDDVAAPTTGRMTPLINGRYWGGSRSKFDQTEGFDAMQAAVEGLQPEDTLFLAAWHFDPTVPLTVPGSVGTWGELFHRKASEGVKIRIIMTDFDPIASVLRAKLYTDFLPALDNLIAALADAARDNLKYIVSQHPATHATRHVATHHQKFMILRSGAATTAFCGGLDIAYLRTPAYWKAPNYAWLWHDIHSKLEGLIALDLQREFVLRWNREKDHSVVPARNGWKPFENLIQAPATGGDQAPDRNAQQLQMLRTVSVQGAGARIQATRRDDIWQGYLRLIGCATRFLYLENQYFREPRMADAIVKQAKSQARLLVIIVAPEQLDDPDDAVKLHGNSLQHEFFARLKKGIPANRLRVYTMFRRIIHSKFIMADDRLLSIGSANANPRGFFLDTELNVMLDDPPAVQGFRHRLWSHDLGVAEVTIAGWKRAAFISQWDAVAAANARLKSTPGKMTGEAIIPFDPLKDKGARQWFIDDVETEYPAPGDGPAPEAGRGRGRVPELISNPHE